MSPHIIRPTLRYILDHRYLSSILIKIISQLNINMNIHKLNEASLECLYLSIIKDMSRARWQEYLSHHSIQLSEATKAITYAKDLGVELRELN